MLASEKNWLAEELPYVLSACWSNYRQAAKIVDTEVQAGMSKWTILDSMLCDYRDDIDNLADVLGVRRSLR